MNWSVIWSWIAKGLLGIGSIALALGWITPQQLADFQTGIGSIGTAIISIVAVGIAIWQGIRSWQAHKAV